MPRCQNQHRDGHPSFSAHLCTHAVAGVAYYASLMYIDPTRTLGGNGCCALRFLPLSALLVLTSVVRILFGKE